MVWNLCCAALPFSYVTRRIPFGISNTMIGNSCILYKSSSVPRRDPTSCYRFCLFNSSLLQLNPIDRPRPSNTITLCPRSRRSKLNVMPVMDLWSSEKLYCPWSDLRQERSIFSTIWTLGSMPRKVLLAFPFSYAIHIPGHLKGGSL